VSILILKLLYFHFGKKLWNVPSYEYFVKGWTQYGLVKDHYSRTCEIINVLKQQYIYRTIYIYRWKTTINNLRSCIVKHQDILKSECKAPKHSKIVKYPDVN
jgi:hypothetical protein